MLGGRGADVKELLSRARRDSSLTCDLTDLRSLLTVDERP